MYNYDVELDIGAWHVVVIARETKHMSTKQVKEAKPFMKLKKQLRCTLVSRAGQAYHVIYTSASMQMYGCCVPSVCTRSPALHK